MPVFSFQLSAFSPIHSIFLRELNGHDEFLVFDNSTPCALQLLNNTIVHQIPGSELQLIEAEKITISDRDYLLSEIYKFTFGNRIESSLDCNECGERYDLNFLLDDLVMHAGNRRNDIQTDDDGFFCGDDGVRFRLPTGEDEIAVWGLPSDEAELLMYHKCLAQPATKGKNEIMAFMEEIGPLLTTNLSTNCPECQSSQKLQFDMQSYLLSRLKNGQKKLTIEVHNIAMTYGWSNKEILDLSRRVRQAYSNLITSN